MPFHFLCQRLPYFSHPLTNCIQKSIFRLKCLHKVEGKIYLFMLLMYIFVESLDNDFKDIEHIFSPTAVHFASTILPIFPFEIPIFPFLFFLVSQSLYFFPPSHHHLSMLLFDFIQQTDISLFGLLNYLRRACILKIKKK